jgi:UDP-N-acetylmuramate-alanine ligase
MKALPLDIGTLHFVGIGGIGMSGIAETLHALGYAVQGSDVAEGANIERLRGLGIDVSIGHRSENIDGASVVVVSTAIGADNATHAGGAPGRNAGRADAAEMVDRRRGHPWQDHNHIAGRRRARRG